MEGRTRGHLRHSLSSPVQSPVTRSLTQEALELHYPLLTSDVKRGSESSRLVMPLIRHDNPYPGCPAGHISQLSLQICQR